MPVRNVSSVAFAAVTEKLDGGLGAGNAKTVSATSVSGDTVIVNTATGANCTVHLDFAISKHEIGYGDRNTADSGSDKETRTVRQHEFAHVGGRNALASKTVLQALCDDVKVKWTFTIKSTGDQTADQATLDSTRATYEGAVEDYINPIVDYLDELVIHETQRTAGKVGVKSAAAIATMLAAISYTDPETGKARTPTAGAMTTAAAAIKAGGAKGDTFAQNSPTPPTVRP